MIECAMQHALVTSHSKGEAGEQGGTARAELRGI